ncbi:MAG: MFS transporter, partial [Acidimicrobiales bacterium]
AMLYRTFPPQDRVRLASILMIPTALAPAIGPVLGGLLVTDLSWRWVFYVNFPIGAAAFIFGLIFVLEQREAQPGRFDLPGFCLAGIGLGALMYGVSEGPVEGWGSSAVVITVVAGVVLLIAMVVFELRTREPMVDLRLLRDRMFRVSNQLVTITMIGFFGVLYVVPLYYQDGRGLSALASGPQYISRSDRRHDRRPGGQSRVVFQNRSSPADSEWSCWHCRCYRIDGVERFRHQSLVDARADVLPRLLHLPRDGQHAGRRLLDNSSSVDREGVDVI